MIAVKAAPVPTAQLRESMCVAGIDLGSEPRWIRLFPIPFRDLADDSKFRKYEEVTVHATRPDNDRRPESWVPIEGSIRTGRFFGTEHGWSARRDRIASVGEWDMCDLIARNRSGSGPETPSLAVVRPAHPPELLITPRDQDQLDRWRSRTAAIANQPSLLTTPTRRSPLTSRSHGDSATRIGAEPPVARATTRPSSTGRPKLFGEGCASKKTGDT